MNNMYRYLMHIRGYDDQTRQHDAPSTAAEVRIVVSRFYQDRSIEQDSPIRQRPRSLSQPLLRKQMHRFGLFEEYSGQEPSISFAGQVKDCLHKGRTGLPLLRKCVSRPDVCCQSVSLVTTFVKK